MAAVSFQKFPKLRKGDLQSCRGKTLVVIGIHLLTQETFKGMLFSRYGTRHWGFRIRRYSSVRQPQMINLESRI